jgi:hypothetical protein
MKWIAEVFRMLFGDHFLSHLAPKLVVMDITNSCPLLVDVTLLM